jgi:hypothetical protein
MNKFSAGRDDEWLFEQQAQMSLNIFRMIQTAFTFRAEYLLGEGIQPGEKSHPACRMPFAYHSGKRQGLPIL